jgi:aspartate 1-decarboxylase
MVHVLDVDNGSRFETYVIEGAYGSREMCVNGAAARLVQPGDRVIVVSYGVYSQPELDLHEPRVVHVDDDNRILRVDADPSAIAAQP